MRAMKATVEIKVYEKDDEGWANDPDANEPVVLESHWNDDRGEKVVLVIDGHRYALVRRHLEAAIKAVTTR